MDLQHCEELVIGLADKLFDAYPLGRPPAEFIDEMHKFTRNLARDYVKSVGRSNSEADEIAAAMMRKFNHRYGWRTETTSMRALARAEPQGHA